MNRRNSLALAYAVALALAASSGPLCAHDTYKLWNGTQFVADFGCPNTTTYGEVINVPANKHILANFTFSLQNYTDDSSMVARAEVYAWNGTEATGSGLYESAPFNISFANSKFHKKVFAPAISVTPGTQYVLFLSIDKDFDQCQNNYKLAWGAVNEDRGSGNFVYQNNRGEYENWTTEAWSHYPPLDLAFEALLTQ